MTEWTSEAKEYLDGYMHQVAALARSQGDDDEDIVAGLREHITNEVEATAGSLVTVDMLQKALAMVGTPEQVVSPDFTLATRERKEKTAFQTVPPPPPRPAPPQEPRIVVNTPAPKSRSGCWLALATFVVLAIVLAVGVPVLLTVVSIAVPNLHRARDTAYESRAIAQLQAVARAESAFREGQGVDIDGDGVSDYGTLQQLSDKGLLAQYSGGDFVLNLTVTPSAEPGGPSFLCTAQPTNDDRGLLKWARIDQTGAVTFTEPPPATIEKTEP